MNVQCKQGRMGTRRHLLQFAVVLTFMVAIAWPGLIVDAPVQAANQGDTIETWIDQVLKGCSSAVRRRNRR